MSPAEKAKFAVYVFLRGRSKQGGFLCGFQAENDCDPLFLFLLRKRKSASHGVKGKDACALYCKLVRKIIPAIVLVCVSVSEI